MMLTNVIIYYIDLYSNKFIDFKFNSLKKNFIFSFEKIII